MFVFKIKNTIPDDANTLCRQLEEMSLRTKSHVHYISNSDNIAFLRYLKVDSILIDLSTLTMEVDFDDLICSIIEIQSTVIIKYPDNEIVKDEFLSIAELYGLEYIKYTSITLTDEPKLDNVIDYATIHEIYNGRLVTKEYYSPLDYMVNVPVNSGEVYYSDGLHSPIHSVDSKALALMVTQVNISSLIDKEATFSYNLISPLPFVLSDSVDELCSKIEEYKYSVFRKISNLTPREITKLPLAVIETFTKGHYVPLDKIKELEEGILSQ